jgi:hypothetical protein
MVWFSEDTLPTVIVLERYLGSLQNEALTDTLDFGTQQDEVSPVLKLQRYVADVLAPFFKQGGNIVVRLFFLEAP